MVGPPHQRPHPPPAPVILFAASCGSTSRRCGCPSSHAARTPPRCGGRWWQDCFPTRPGASWTVSEGAANRDIAWGGRCLRPVGLGARRHVSSDCWRADGGAAPWLGVVREEGRVRGVQRAGAHDAAVCARHHGSGPVLVARDRARLLCAPAREHRSVIRPQAHAPRALAPIADPARSIVTTVVSATRMHQPRPPCPPLELLVSSWLR